MAMNYQQLPMKNPCQSQGHVRFEGAQHQQQRPYRWNLSPKPPVKKEDVVLEKNQQHPRPVSRVWLYQDYPAVRLDRIGAPNLSNEVRDELRGPSQRLISRGEAKGSTLVAANKRDEGSSEENYPEPFKKLLKAQLNDDKLKTVYVKNLEITTKKSVPTSLTERRKIQSTTVPGTPKASPTEPSVTVNKSNQDGARRVQQPREPVIRENKFQQRTTTTVPPNHREQTHRSSQFSESNNTSSETVLQTLRSTKKSSSSETSAEQLLSVRQLTVRARYSERNEQSSRERFSVAAKASEEVEEAKSSNSNVRPVIEARKRVTNPPERVQRRGNVRVLSTTTPGPTTTVQLITPRPVRTYTRKQNTLSYLTSTTTEATTTTRKPFSPAPRAGSLPQRKPPPVERNALRSSTRQPADDRANDIGNSREVTQTVVDEIEEGPQQISLLYTNPVEYLRRRQNVAKSTKSASIKSTTASARANESYTKAPAKHGARKPSLTTRPTVSSKSSSSNVVS
uniref:Uncharacterized protein n=1 Tax=Anopheles maculatus TaxID=74869 RepID=A0A182T1P6_9DIPT